MSRLYNIIFFLFLTGSCCAQSGQDSLIVYARKWSRDKDRKIVYSDWLPFKSRSVASLQILPLKQSLSLSKYGGLHSIHFKPSGFFRIEKTGNKNWLVDPDGHAFIAVALNSVRKGTSPQNQAAFARKFQQDLSWITEVKQQMDQSGFNMIGSWSDTAAIRAYNQLNPDKGIVYTIQLSILATFAQQQRRLYPERKDWPVLAHLFDDEFALYAAQRCAVLKTYKDDPWLAGLFSDNELAFQGNLIKEFLSIPQAGNPARKAALQVLQRFNVKDSTAIDTDVQKQFAGYVADLYYRKTGEAIRKYDSNHLIMGSRLHSSAKNNPYILKACEENLDVISMNYYGNWTLTEKEAASWNALSKPFMITEFYTKAEDSGLPNVSGAGWLVRKQEDRGLFYQNFCISLLSIPNCAGWHWFRYQDNDPSDPKADPSNNDSNKGIVDNKYNPYRVLMGYMQELNSVKYNLMAHTLEKNRN
jgi:hypothetical protein